MNIRQILRKIILDIISPFSTPKDGVHILNGHYISSHKIDDADKFYQLLAKLKQDVDFINIQEATKLIYEGQTNVREKLVAFTFDDGYKECFTHLKPVLDSFKLKAGFFINPNFIDGDEGYINNYLKNVVFLNSYKPPMTWDEIFTLHTDGHVIGAHTMDHLRLNIDDEEKLNYQIIGCKHYLEHKLKYDCEYFAYPYGQLTDISKEAKKVAFNYFKYNFTQSNYTKYYSFGNYFFINRRHFEGNWNVNHVRYFLKEKS